MSNQIFNFYKRLNYRIIETSITIMLHFPPIFHFLQHFSFPKYNTLVFVNINQGIVWAYEYVLTGLRGGLDRIKSKMISWASFLTFGGNSPSTITFFKLYRRDRISSIRISYGVRAYSMGVLVKSTFFSLTPWRSSLIVCIHRLAYEK